MFLYMFLVQHSGYYQLHPSNRFMAQDSAKQPSFCASNSTSSSLPNEQCPHHPQLPAPEVVESQGQTAQDHYVVLPNVGLWYRVAYKFRIPLVDGGVVSTFVIYIRWEADRGFISSTQSFIIWFSPLKKKSAMSIDTLPKILKNHLGRKHSRLSGVDMFLAMHSNRNTAEHS